MGKKRKNTNIDSILKTWEMRGIEEMTKRQAISIRLHMRSMNEEELTRLVNDKKKPIYICNIARGLLDKRAFIHQEKMDERDFGNAPQEINVKSNIENMSIEELDAEIERLKNLNED